MATFLGLCPLRLSPLPALPTFSVIIPTFNRAHVVGEAVASALAQRYGELEVIVVDDGSIDDTATHLERLDDPRVWYRRIAHRGVSAARNAGLALARGQLISFLDSDDLWVPDKLLVEVQFLRRHPEVGAVFSDLEKRDGATITSSFMRTTEVFRHRLPVAGGSAELVLSPREMRACLLQEAAVKTPTLTVRREAIDAVGGFDERWSSSEDWEFLLRLARVVAFGYIDRPLAVIRVSPDSLHRLDQERGDLAMLDLLSGWSRAGADRTLRAAARRGVGTRTKHLGWHYLDSGRRLAGARVYLRGFMATRQPVLLLRAMAAAAAAARSAGTAGGSRRPTQ